MCIVLYCLLLHIWFYLFAQFDIDTNTTTTRLLDGQAMFGRDFPSDGLIVSIPDRHCFDGFNVILFHR